MEEAGEIALTAEVKSRSLGNNAVTSNNELFRALVAEHQDMVLNTCYRFVMNREDAEDLAQDVFVEVHRSLESFREESKLSTWIYRIAVTKSLDHLRRMKRKKRFSSIKRIIGIDDPAEDLPSTSGDNPEQALAGKERAGILQDALNTLPDNQKTAFLLSKQDGYTNSEIADILQTSVSAVESLIHRAKKNLHDKLSRYYTNN
ncbi:MAG: sigma-70 family RNA polymerase sigma factor [Chlorobiaceae bacterium]|jgi:RNA polymerase sigma-70 factor, ECF subfamily|nr:sigma-70 family RNA polymerase sigma factor [Chlorobiaceae bacterium]